MECCGLPQLWARRPGGALGLKIELKERRRAGAKKKRCQVAALQNRFMSSDVFNIDLPMGHEPDGFGVPSRGGRQSGVDRLGSGDSHKRWGFNSNTFNARLWAA
jgi:hypothetical protein